MHSNRATCALLRFGTHNFRSWQANYKVQHSDTVSMKRNQITSLNIQLIDFSVFLHLGYYGDLTMGIRSQVGDEIALWMIPKFSSLRNSVQNGIFWFLKQMDCLSITTEPLEGCWSALTLEAKLVSLRIRGFRQNSSSNLPIQAHFLSLVFRLLIEKGYNESLDFLRLKE